MPISPPAATLPQRPPRQLEQPQLPPPATGVPEPAAPQPKVRF